MYLEVEIYRIIAPLQRAVQRAITGTVSAAPTEISPPCHPRESASIVNGGIVCPDCGRPFVTSAQGAAIAVAA